MADSLAAFRLDGKVAAITGGARGIGRAAAEALGGAGAAVAILDLDAAAAQKTAEEIGASAHQCDVTDEASVEAAMAEVAAWHGGIDIVVNNAGIGLRHAAVDHPLAD